MARKYQKFDKKLFAWLHENRSEVTTASAIQALGISCSTTQRHVSRRFTQLEDRGIIKCTLRGTTRVCEVLQDLPADFAARRWNPTATDRFQNQTAPSMSPTTAAIPASNSEEFEAAGGKIERLGTNWDRPMRLRPLGVLDPFEGPEFE
jgi:hypothetical protein